MTIRLARRLIVVVLLLRPCAVHALTAEAFASVAQDHALSAPATVPTVPNSPHLDGPRFELPPNIEVTTLLKDVVIELLEKSPTFRRQCERIADARFARVRIVAFAPFREQNAPRARSTITRHAFGALRATIEIPVSSEQIELIGHEFEHVLERLEGLDLPALARNGGEGVAEVQEGVFESARAIGAGRRVADEALGSADPMRTAATSTMMFLLRTIRGRMTPAPQPTRLLRR